MQTGSKPGFKWLRSRLHQECLPDVTNVARGSILNPPRARPGWGLMRNSQPNAVPGTVSEEREKSSGLSLVIKLGGLQMHGRTLVEETTDSVDVHREQRRQLLSVVFAAAYLSSADEQRDLPGG